MAEKKLITINSRKMDGRIHKTWKASLIKETDRLIAFIGTFNSETTHPELGIIRRNTISYEYYWKKKWFSIFRFHEPEGDLRNFYCNVNLPPTFENNVLDFIDLDLDILVRKDLSYEVLDREEFEQNSQKYGYSQEIIEKTGECLDDLQALIRDRVFPFDF